MRKLLERELRLFDLIDPRDLRSYAWYHGSTLPGGRKGAEAEIPNDGDFLVRDCNSQPGNYVLSVRHKGQPLHFVINKVRISGVIASSLSASSELETLNCFGLDALYTREGVKT